MRVTVTRALLIVCFAVSPMWMDDGRADENRHWAFERVHDVVPPSVSDDGWIRVGLDAFILRRLQSESIEPSSPASRETWLRRVTFDLVGVPPSLSEIDSFLRDASPEAYDKVVDRLLASPAYGERLTLQWLDVARYADTYGYDNDGLIRMWPWRDWAIRAFNSDLPYDQFIRWQLAGDLLPNPTVDQRLATGFNRLHRQNAEGGVIPEEFVVEYVVDRVQTFGNAFLGLSLECARCHDHKFDPISQREFYSLYALFGNIDEVGTYPEKTGATPTPNMVLYAPGQEDHHAQLRQAITAAEGALREIRQHARDRFVDWQKGGAELQEPSRILYLSFDEELSHGASTANQETDESKNDDPSYRIPDTARFVPGPSGQAVRFAGDHGIDFKKAARFERTDPFTIATWLRWPGSSDRLVVCHNSKPAWEVGGRGFELAISDGYVEFGLCHVWPGNAIRIRAQEQLTAQEWVHVAVTYDGSSRADGVRLYLNGAVISHRAIRDHLYATIGYANRPPPFTIGARRSETGFENGELDEFSLYGRRLTALEVGSLTGSTRLQSGSASRNDAHLFEYYLEREDEEYVRQRKHLKNAREAESEFSKTLRTIMVMHENTKPPAAFVLRRGAYDRPGDAVGPGVPQAILTGDPSDRLELASWLVDREHPLTSRVTVNRIWQVFFGRGLVNTPDDFGSQGEPPSHPQLLDYLSGMLMRSGWNVKALCRMIALSATYRQDSSPRSELTDRDPNNVLLARGPRHRLSAEQIRDGALAASDLLTTRVGGPSVKPYQPEGLWREVGPMRFKLDSGADLYRKSMYTFWKRTAPPPTMLSFDAVSREVCIAERDSTVTPAQALILLNDPQFVEAARVLAENVLLSHGVETGAAIAEVFRLLTSRHPRADEVSALRAGHREQQRLFAAAPSDAKAYVSTGERKRDSVLNAVDLAAMTSIVQLIMSFHEFQMKL